MGSRGGRGRRTWLAAAAGVAVLLVPTPVRAVPPTSPDCRPPQHHQLISDTPWTVKRYAPQRIWPITSGENVTVAVIDSGVDGEHPQLRGAVDRGLDLLDRQPSAAVDDGQAQGASVDLGGMATAIRTAVDTNVSSAVRRSPRSERSRRRRNWNRSRACAR